MFSLVGLLIRLMKLPMTIIFLPLTIQKMMFRLTCLVMMLAIIAVVVVVIVLVAR